MSNLNEVLETRGNEYGDFSKMADLSQMLKSVVITDVMTSVEREAMEMILLKVTRISCGNPHNIDSWMDIAGYAQLVVKELSEPVCASEPKFIIRTSAKARGD